MEINKNALGKRIKNIRVNEKDTLESFAQKINSKTQGAIRSGKSNVSRWEKGENIPNDLTLKTIAEIGNMSVDELSYGSTEDIINTGITDSLKKMNKELKQTEEKEVFNQIKREIDFFPYKYTEYEEIYNLSKERLLDYVVGKRQDDKTVILQIIESIEELSNDFLKSNYFKKINIDSEELTYNYFFLCFQTDSQVQFELIDGMNEQIYHETLEILNESIDALNNLYNAHFKLRFDSNDLEIESKKLMLSLIIKRFYNELPLHLQTSTNREFVEKYVLQNAKDILPSNIVMMKKDSFNTLEVENIDELSTKANNFSIEVDLNELIEILEGKKPFYITYMDHDSFLLKKKRIK
ncbi:helix-turn-helix domain-containing protein [Jeotgalibaca sp. MA1X17-3]|uniref:helix-turn-helix domain-containing protein n=1 Tax=Jeotgalibaca sp. MA1X17-3 TaxID=2908211 RepID=UPI001F3E147E|nr:helix-turn-helix transcriptional regulator [Jeotgalibaca sp. MA1X17-3]UJF14997.1 helix-turn-helix domain-containing protein [Jeotgalibaca sp. MA1X17-3]